MVRGLDVANLSKSVSPADDFYTFANGSWCDKNPIPAEYSRWGTFEELVERNLKVLRELCEKSAAASEPGVTQKVGAFWRAAMDTQAVESAGSSPLHELLALCDAAASGAVPLSEALARLHTAGVPVFFGLSDSSDAKRSDWSIAQLRQGGLGLPDRDYYVEEKHAAVLCQYEAHVACMLRLLGDSDPETAAKAVVALETRLSRTHLTRTERRDPDRTYNPTTVEALQSDGAPSLDWRAYFGALGAKPELGSLNVDTPGALREAVAAASDVAREDLRSYLRWHTVNSAAEYLSDAFVQADFSFFAKTLSGQKEIKPRWKRIISEVNNSLPEALGQLYVQSCFAGDAKQRALTVVNSVRAAMEQRLTSLTWMADETKAKALAKLATFKVKIGFPDEWIDYSTLQIQPGAPWFSMVLACRAFDRKRSLARINAPVDRQRWLMAPQVVNAYYNPPLNEIVFPAAILQPPFFDQAADDAVNYGAMGAVVGHEITHGFDDQGRKYDADGNLACWWSEEDAAEFTRRTETQTAQTAAFVVHTKEACASPIGPFKLTGSRGSALCQCTGINAQLTLGEDTADLGGLKLSYAAFLATSPQAQSDEPDEDGFSPAQRFTLAWAQVWRANITTEAAALRLATDPHAPHTFRVNGPLSNTAVFQEAWGVKPGDGMYRAVEARVDIW